MDSSLICVEDSDLPIKLTDDDIRRLACEPGLNEFQRDKLEKDAKKNWDLFYKRNGDRFFKNRYWTRREFKELFQDGTIDGSNEAICLLEVGCGCGNFALPLLGDDDLPRGTFEKIPTDVTTTGVPANMFIYCCDISDKAIEILKSNPTYVRNHPERVKAFVADITATNFDRIRDQELDGHSMDIVSLIFVLSALDPERMLEAIANISSIIKSGGLVLLRDYAIYDKAMLRFSEKSKISEQFYVRQDGTRAYFFSKEQLLEMFVRHNFDCLSIDYIRSETVNKATEDTHSRIFVQAKFRKLEPPRS